MSVNAAINAGASAAAGAGLQDQPGAMYAPAKMKPAFITQPSYAFSPGNVAPSVTRAIGSGREVGDRCVVGFVAAAVFEPRASTAVFTGESGAVAIVCMPM